MVMSRVKVKIAMFMGQFDSMSSIRDNKEVISKLPNGTMMHCKILPGLGHFLIGDDVDVSWFEHVIPVLDTTTAEQAKDGQAILNYCHDLDQQLVNIETVPI